MRLTSIFIQSSVTSIGDDIVDNCYDVKIYCVSPSKALDYAIENDIPYTIVIPVATIKLSATSLNWVVGKSQKLTYAAAPANATNKAVAWSTSNSKVATVDSTGLVKAAGVGTAVITCIAKDRMGSRAACSVKVLPGTPTGVKATLVSYSSIKVSWAAVSGATGYIVYRYNPTTKSYVKIKTTSASALSYTDTSLKINVKYYYKVRAYKTVSGVNYTSAYSATVSATCLPTVPGSFKAARASSTSIKLSWAAVAGATGYEVWRWSNATEKYEKIKTTTSFSYLDTGLKTGNTYSYKVRAYRTVSGVKYFGAFSSVKSAKAY